MQEATQVLLDARFILISDKKWTKICEDFFRKTRRRTPQGCRLARTTTKYCGKQTAKIIYFLFEFSIIPPKLKFSEAKNNIPHP